MRAELSVAAVVVVLVVVVDLRGAIGFSSVTILTYYALANASALTLPARRRGAGALALLGLVGCVALALALPLASLLTGAGVLAAGAAVRWVTRRGAGHGGVTPRRTRPRRRSCCRPASAGAVLKRVPASFGGPSVISMGPTEPKWPVTP